MGTGTNEPTLFSSAVVHKLMFPTELLQPYEAMAREVKTLPTRVPGSEGMSTKDYSGAPSTGTI